jgi:hypothetical protein
MIWNNNVLKNEISADTAPLFRAVKKEEPKIPNPLNKNEAENNRNALVVSSVSDGSYPTKILAKVDALKTAKPNNFEADGVKKIDVHKLHKSEDDDKGVTKEKFDKMSYKERTELYENDRETYDKLSKKEETRF